MSQQKATSKRRITDADRAAAVRLRALWDKKKRELGFTQTDAAIEMGFSNASAVNNFLQCRTALNTNAILKFSKFLRINPEEIRPDISELLGAVVETQQEIIRLSKEEIELIKLLRELPRPERFIVFNTVFSLKKTLDDSNCNKQSDTDIDMSDRAKAGHVGKSIGHTKTSAMPPRKSRRIKNETR